MDISQFIANLHLNGWKELTNARETDFDCHFFKDDLYIGIEETPFNKFRFMFKKYKNQVDDTSHYYHNTCITVLTHLGTETDCTMFMEWIKCIA